MCLIGADVEQSKIVMVTSLAVYAALVVFGNITDYGSNFAFVQHTLSMDTAFPANHLMYRAITTPALHHIAYWLIIAGEALAGLLLARGAWQLWRARAASPAAFAAAKRPVALGATIAFLVWFVGFQAIAGEWFAMWQSAAWNGHESAFRILALILLVLIFVMQPEDRISA
jgi:predicted small integral membrane protein